MGSELVRPATLCTRPTLYTMYRLSNFREQQRSTCVCFDRRRLLGCLRHELCLYLHLFHWWCLSEAGFLRRRRGSLRWLSAVPVQTWKIQSCSFPRWVSSSSGQRRRRAGMLKVLKASTVACVATIVAASRPTLSHKLRKIACWTACCSRGRSGNREASKPRIQSRSLSGIGSSSMQRRAATMCSKSIPRASDKKPKTVHWRVARVGCWVSTPKLSELSCCLSDRIAGT